MNYHFKFASRDILKNRLITTGSLISMVIGVLSAFLIYMWVDSELQTDRFHSEVDRIYIPVIQQSAVDNINPISAGLFFRLDYKKYPSVKSKLYTAFYTPERIKLKFDNNEYRGGGLIADSTFFDFFDFKLLVGEPNEILDNPSHIVLTKSFSKKIFGDKDPLGETIYLECDRKGYYQVAGILEDIPSNSTLSFDFLVPSQSQEWWGNSGMEFILTNDSFDQSTFNAEVKEAGRSHPQFKESTLSTVAFSDVYFHHNFSNSILAKHGNMDEVNSLFLVAFVILLVSILNFTNMQSTLMLSQLKTKGIKQVNGATKFDFLLELLASRLLYALLSIVIVFGLFMLVKDAYLRFLGITFGKPLLEVLLIIAIGVFLFTIISTLFSIIQSSKLVTSQALMGQLNDKKGSTGRILTTIQYVFAIALIIATSVVYKQFKYMQNKDLGYDPNGLVAIKFFDRLPYNFEDEETYKKDLKAQESSYELVRNELLKMPGIISYSQGLMPFDGSASTMSWKLSGSDFEYTETSLMTIDPDYANMLGLEMVAGRFFSDSLDVSRQHKVVINKAAMDYWGITDLSDVKVASSSWDGEDDPWRVIGVVDDFHYAHLSKKIEPAIMVFFRDVDKEFSVRIASKQYKATLERLGALYELVNPSQPFNYTILEDKLQAQYERERKLSEIFMLFTLVGLMISSVGLFTFALYETRKRIKEIGIRKVVGASETQVISLLTSGFLKWVLLAFVIACPLGWYFMNEWLANFASQTELSWWIFAIAGVSAIVLATCTVIGQSYVAAKRNPVEALRYE
ncbi:ABC transporter permease [Roseivirga sp.]|uniref:ABC transporter permease n=1 Tax=Roseivirga sp. TaxID=1964215 RepID=UPI002B270978|nr:ABC transporter permease [Roseivirga sp.]